MPLIAIVVAWALSVFPGGIPALSFVPNAQATPSSQEPGKKQDGPTAQTLSQPDAQSAQQPNSDQSSPRKPTSPCTETSPPATTESKDCNPAAPNTNTKPPNATGKATSPKKKVVRNGSTTEPTVQIAPSVPGRQASKELQTTNQLLATTDVNLKKLSGRTLTQAQQETLTQIKNYMEQARKAADNGDPQRAYNLAHKANLLSTELAGP
jgi:cytoskeletal protein RodZ